MDSARLLTAEEFAAREADDDFELRWSELAGGRIVSLEPPAPEHGTVVLNFAKAIAKYLQHAQDEKGYAGFETGLVVARNPDTVRRPPVSFFVGGQLFAELEQRLTETRPALVVEIASTNDRRRAMRERVESYLQWGVRTVWVADPAEKNVHVIQSGKPPRLFAGSQSVPGSPVFANFRVGVTELFTMPE
ncbi:MAG TPA: Uma2 family endonuclease [Planctomycetaceae bacterium]|jgi:Uma2 family endonuclease|nr:Uma2 family endonuclease [Planctomycetaceae bacterium]